MTAITREELIAEAKNVPTRRHAANRIWSQAQNLPAICRVCGSPDIESFFGSWWLCEDCATDLLEYAESFTGEMGWPDPYRLNAWLRLLGLYDG